MAVAGLADMDTRAPRSGEVVSLLGFGIAPQEATVEVSDASRLLLRVKSSEGLSVGAVSVKK